MIKKLRYMRHFLTIIVILVLTVISTSTAMAGDDKPSASFSVAVLSKYIWRGQELSRDSMVIQPSITASYMGFSANLWSNMDTDPYTTHGIDNPANWTETDFTFSYSRNFGALDVGGGYIYYGLDGCSDSQEIFLNLGLDSVLSPSLTLYREIHDYQHWYLLLSVSHSFKITKAVSLELSGSASYLKSMDSDEYPKINSSGQETGDKYNALHDGVISASLPVSVGEYITVTPSVSYTFPLSNDARHEMKWRSMKGTDDDFVYGGITVSMAF